MALPKSSFYVWFLGAKASGGIRGEEHVRTAVRHLVERERRVEPLKVTLQVSGKGVKMVRPASASAPLSSPTLKHLIPDDALAFASQAPPPDDDVVGTIVLSDERWPAHVHVFRCDSPETASLLCSHLSALADRPHHQRRLVELENRLAPNSSNQRQHRQQAGHSLRRTLSDGRSVRTESAPSSPTPSSSSAESSTSTSEGVAVPRGSLPVEGWPSPELADEKVVALYDSLAAELRAVLGAGRSSPPASGKDGRSVGAVRAPILLPPRDYDTMHRMRGRVDGVDERRCLTSAVVGLAATSGKAALAGNAGVANGSSGKSSGFGSDEASGSPTRGPPSSSGKSDDDDWESRPIAVTVPRRMRSSASAAARIPMSRDRDRMAQTVERRAVSASQQKNSRILDHNSYRELPDGKRFPGLDRETARPPIEIDNKNNGSRDRVSQAAVSRQNGSGKKMATKMAATDQQPEKRYFRYNERTEWMPAVYYR